MAIVPNRDGQRISSQDAFVDRAYASVNRVNAGTPIGSLTPQFVNELVQDTTNRVLFRATGVTNNDWVVVTPRAQQ